MSGHNSKTWRPTAAFGTLIALLLLVACAAGDQGYSDQAYDEDRAARVFAAGYEDIAAIYIEEIPSARLAEAGLQELHELDERLALSRDGSRFRLLVEEETAGSYQFPGSASYRDWGRLTATIVDEARKHSDVLAEAQRETLYDAVFRGIIGELDGYSRYSGREEARENRASRSGFGGIGVRIRMDEEGVRVLSVMEQTPAESAGLRGQDLILAIDDVPAKDLDQMEAVHHLRGPVDSRVRLLLEREGRGEPFEVAVRRAHIVPQTVHYHIEDDVAVFRLSSFNHATTSTLRGKLREARAELGDRLAGYVLDLRSNPGGLLDQAVSVSDLFLEEGEIVSTRGRHPESHQYFQARHDAQSAPVPMVILVNGHSASASEIVAAALQDSGRAVVAGSSSFGKGTVQTVLRLPNEGELTLTWARFHAPSGYSLDHRGVMPDVCVGDGNEAVSDVMAAIRRGRHITQPSLRRLHIEAGNEPAINDFRAHCPALEEERDLDLQVALHLLQEPALYMTAKRGSTLTAEASAQGEFKAQQPAQ